jgi:hypothetical protein
MRITLLHQALMPLKPDPGGRCESGLNFEKASLDGKECGNEPMSDTPDGIGRSQSGALARPPLFSPNTCDPFPTKGSRALRARRIYSKYITQFPCFPFLSFLTTTRCIYTLTSLLQFNLTPFQRRRNKELKIILS